jgi:predicted esterase
VRIWAAALFAAISVAAQQAGAAWNEKAYAVASRPGVETTFVVASDNRISDRNAVKHLLVLFSGGAGAIASPAAGVNERGEKFSLRGFMAEQLGVVVSVGLPTDKQEGLPLEWRETAEHVQDASAVVNVLAKQYPEARITLLGFSNGARSASHIGAALRGQWKERLQGVALLSASIDAFREDWIAALDATKDRPKVPLLVVQHKRDSCLPYRDIEEAAKWHHFISVEDRKQPRVNTYRRDCDRGSAHQFAGREEKVYQAVVDWIKTGRVATTIE